MSEDADILLLRNVHPHFVNNGRVGSGGFTPSEAHNFELSVDLSVLSSPLESFERHTSQNGLPSAGVFAVTVGDFENNEVEIKEDRLPENVSHMLADFGAIKAQSRSAVKRVGRKLAAVATQNGQQA